MTKREQQVLSAIRQNPLISQKALGEQLGISREAAANHIMNLTRKGFIRGKGYLLNELLDVMVIGGCTLDIQGIPKIPGLPGDSIPGQISMTPGGVGRNIAENIARLGHNVRLLSAVGRDEAGQQVLTATASAGVDTSSVEQLADKPTPIYLSILDNNHELIQAINDMALIEQLSPELLTLHTAALQHCQTLVIDANLPEKTLEHLFTIPNLPAIFADCVSASKAKRLNPWLHRIFCLKPNRMEAGLLWGKPVKSEVDLHECAQWFHEQGVQQLVISLGKEGVFASYEQQQLLMPSPDIQTTSVAGAGDAMMAGLLHSYLQNFDFEQSITTAQTCAAMALEYHATINPELTAEAIRKRIQSSM
ncbi:PfkB family carbohydrate kinase [Parendozoicomonas sp. Alg238-R29]|uniref:PfkB family carbohydrate kinase n=1 Tax=Parendozoicomonas sp. Alg238-R29 TaxID=2993446 RepID=UPI00248E73BD|nr:PfkB family carbohydrate kinase [Parendozoicomonas sp. Alg238-R29]